MFLSSAVGMETEMQQADGVRVTGSGGLQSAEEKDGESGICGVWQVREQNASVTSTAGSLQPTALIWQDYSSAELKVRWPEKVTGLINHIWPSLPQTAALSVCTDWSSGIISTSSASQGEVIVRVYVHLSVRRLGIILQFVFRTWFA